MYVCMYVCMYVINCKSALLHRSLVLPEVSLYKQQLNKETRESLKNTSSQIRTL
jgi:hypothetical protein